MLLNFNDVYNLKSYVASTVESMVQYNIVLQKIFQSYKTNCLLWAERFRTMNEWAQKIDMLIIAYVLKINIITVGNYVHGFILNDMQLNLNAI